MLGGQLITFFGLTVVVTALGINKEKDRLGYATQEVKGVELIKAREQEERKELGSLPYHSSWQLSASHTHIHAH